MGKNSGNLKILQLLTVCIVIFIINHWWTLEVSAKTIVLTEGENIQEAINKSEHGDVLRLEKGVYKGPITISKSITLIGEEGTVIDGMGEGNVITVNAGHVTIEGLTITNSGKGMEDSGIFLEKTKEVVVENNTFKEVNYGIYIKNGENNVIQGNEITSFSGEKTKKGNGIHIFKGKDNLIEKNVIHSVQDGIYFDFANRVTVKGNEVTNSRYGLHYMFSVNIKATENVSSRNVVGYMIMDSANLYLYNNIAKEQFHYRGFGVLIYQSENVILEGNEIIENSTGISFERAHHTEVFHNVIASNQVGLEFIYENENNVFYENNFIANVVSSKVGKEKIALDNGKKGNYWDDYKSFDISGDGIGEEPYIAGSLYDNLLKREPLWQLYFESPAIQLWSKAEAMFPSLGTVEVADHYPLIDPIPLGEEKKEGKNRDYMRLIISVMMLVTSFFILVRGRRYS